MNAKCDYCDQRATTLAGDTNGVLVCEDHVRLFAEREIAAAIDHAERYPGYEKHKRHMLTPPPAFAASTGTSEDVGLSEAATELAVRQWTIGFENLRAGDWEYLARWLAAREAAARAEAWDEACEHDIATCRGDQCAYNPYRIAREGR